ncbi:uncharacterized protein LOC111357295 [Spodoptera litura]|uniref:Uncharacterized protein LOC111357295 n=1 Tax=Spodoptera litura TaxID=69820 RepID=A0A9J7EBB2_SPOLT|nr:uncharacterized protein LOC111357295 [Spodoptera litura]
MSGPLRFLIVLCVFAFVASKELHEKLTLDAKDKDDKGFMNLFNNQDDLNKNERYARHVKAVSESVLDHLFNEIRQQYNSPNYNSNSPIPRLMKNLNRELKRKEQSKLQKEKEKRKGVGKKKNKISNKRRIRITTKTN